MLTLLAFIVTIGLLVTIHEYGHFQVARWCGVKVLRFSIGFGKPLWIKKFGKDQTEFVIAAIPLGGFVKMLDEREVEREFVIAAIPLGGFVKMLDEREVEREFAGENQQMPYSEADLTRAFNRQSVYKRIAIVLAGPIANLLLAIFLYWALLSMGVLGMKPIIGKVFENSPAAIAGMQTNDIVLAANQTEVKSWNDFVLEVRKNPNTTLDVLVQRKAEEITLKVTPKSNIEHELEVGVIGVAVADTNLIKIHYSPVESLNKAVKYTWDTSILSLKMMGKLLTGNISVKNLSGPVTIAEYAGQSAQLGIKTFIGFLAFISISLGVMNLLPIPVLDGGHLMYYMVEILTGKPVSESAMIIGQKIGFSLLGLMMILALYNDINRLITG
jgi:regulator of sigma E protease